jgi:hypothetical protein
MSPSSRRATHARLQQDVWEAGRDEFTERAVHLAALVLKHADRDLDPGGSQRGDSFPRDERVRVDHPDDDARYAFCDETISAGRRLADMATRLQVDVEGRVREVRESVRPRVLDRANLGVRAAEEGVKTRPITRSAETSTAPTRGLGRAWPRPFAARARASRI